MILERKTAGYIAEKLGTFKHVVRDVAKNNRLKLNYDITDSRDLFGRIRGRKGKYEANDRNNEIKELLNKGETFDEIGEKYNLTRERVRQIAGFFGIKRQEDKKAVDKIIIAAIKQDIANDLSYEEILKKYNLDYDEEYRLIQKGLPPLGKVFREKRDAVILEEFSKGKSATEILSSDNKFLNGKTKIGSINRVYQIATANNIYKHPEIGNRNAGGCFEDKKVLRYIKMCRDDYNRPFKEIAKTLNSWGKRTITGKKFTEANTQAKYNMIVKHSL